MGVGIQVCESLIFQGMTLIIYFLGRGRGGKRIALQIYNSNRRLQGVVGVVVVLVNWLGFSGVGLAVE